MRHEDLTVQPQLGSEATMTDAFGSTTAQTKAVVRLAYALQLRVTEWTDLYRRCNRALAAT